MIYIASPYSHPDPAVMEHRFIEACRYTAFLMRQGIHAFSPISHSHSVAKCGLPTTWEFWKWCDFAFLEFCDEFHVLMLDGWEQSKGVSAEIEEAKRRCLVVKYITPPPPENSCKNQGGVL